MHWSVQKKLYQAYLVLLFDGAREYHIPRAYLSHCHTHQCMYCSPPLFHQLAVVYYLQESTLNFHMQVQGLASPPFYEYQPQDSLLVHFEKVTLQPTPDTISWRWTNSGIYTTESAYHASSMERSHLFGQTKLFKAKMEPKYWFFVWLALLTTENLTIHRWPHDSMYILCQIHLEMVRHLLLQCSRWSVRRS